VSDRRLNGEAREKYVEDCVEDGTHHDSDNCPFPQEARHRHPAATTRAQATKITATATTAQCHVIITGARVRGIVWIAG
jgi:hypothetical protein